MRRNSELYKQFYGRGYTAYGAGIACSPAKDKDFMSNYKSGGRWNGARIGDKASREAQACMKAWVTGWTEANIANSKWEGK